MSVDPVAGAAASVADVQALIDAEHAVLAAAAATLRASVSVGDVVPATVLPSNGLTDLIDILGNRVAAALPDTVRPGDTLAVRVNGFNGDQILFQIVDAANATTEQGAATAASSDAIAAPAANLALLPSFLSTPSIAPPTAVFVAASISQAAPAAPAAPGNAPPTLGAIGTAPGAPTPPPVIGSIQPEAPPSATTQLPIPGAAASGPSSNPNTLQISVRQVAPIEARIAAANASIIGRSGLLAPLDHGAVQAGPPSAGAIQPPVPQSPAGSLGAGQPPARPFVVPPTITARGLAPAPAAATPSLATRITIPTQTGVSNGNATGLAAFREPVALLRALRLPVTPTNVAGAKLALDSPQRLPHALATLEAALPAGGDDPRVTTLRTLTAFIGKIDPQSPQLAAQISAYVDHVVDGAEPKLVTLLAAVADAADLPSDAPASPAGSPPAAGPSANLAGGAASIQPAGLAPTPGNPAQVAGQLAHPEAALANAVAAERTAAVGHDLKSTLLSIAATPPAGAGPDLAATVASAITAITSVQLTAQQALTVNPNSVAFTIPVVTQGGYSQAHVSVHRDAPDQRGKPLDGDNFHIGFVLDTKRLGTVVIDLQTVGRTVKISVKTESTRTADLFRDQMDRLKSRLVTLRYSVAAADSGVAPPSSPASVTGAPTPAPVLNETHDGAVNLRA